MVFKSNRSLWHMGAALAASLVLAASGDASARGFQGSRGGGAYASNGSWGARGPGGQTRSGSYGTTSNGTHYANGSKGGSAYAGNGSWGATGANGRTNSGHYGTTGNGTHYATGAYGGGVASNNGAWGASRNGQVAYGSAGRYGYGGGAVHPPAVVNQYYGTGCYNCGGWNGGGVTAAAGFVAGAALGSAASQQNAYGATYAVLPEGCSYQPVGGTSYYTCGGVWYTPYYGANGTYYRVSPPP